MDDTKKSQCAHAGCSCLVANDSRYCSPHCETLKTGSELACECGHEHCAGKID